MNGPAPIMLVMLSAVALSMLNLRSRWGCSAGVLLFVGAIGAVICAGSYRP